MHRLRSESPLLLSGTYGKFARKHNFKRSAFASRSPARALAAGLPRQDHVSITTDKLFRLHTDEFNEMPSKLDCIEISRSF